MKELGLRKIEVKKDNPIGYLRAIPERREGTGRELVTYIHTYTHTYIHTYIHTYMRACMGIHTKSC